MKLRTLVPSLGVAFGLFVSVACSSPGDQCAKAAPTPDGDCTADTLQCPYSFNQDACDGTGTTTSIATSCTCTDGKWDCPSPAPCPPP